MLQAETGVVKHAGGIQKVGDKTGRAWEDEFMIAREQWAGPWEIFITLDLGRAHWVWMRRYWDGSSFKWHLGPVVPRV